MEMNKNQSITPRCCKEVQKTNTVYLSYAPAEYYGSENGFKDIQPTWRSGRWNEKFQGWGSVEVKFCPHCATPVPPIKRRNTKRKICSVIDGGYYCNTCKKRLRECTCYRPEYAWEPDYSEDENLKLLNKLRDRLRKEKYKATIKEYKFHFYKYHFLRIEGREIFGGACTPNNEANSYLNGKLAVDLAECFDKWSKCPIKLPLPKNKKEIDFVVKKLEWLQTKKGFDISNDYKFDEWITEYPREG